MLETVELAPSARRGRGSAGGIAVSVAAAVYGVVFAAAAALYYLSFHEARLDMGDMVQAIWSAAHGHLFDFTTPTGQQLSRLGAHADPFLLVLVPLWWLWPSPILPLVLQALAVASGVFPVYWLARKHLVSERAAVQFAAIYLLYPATQFNAFTPPSGFHPVSFAVPLILYAVWFLDEDRLVAFAACALLAATTKEEVPIAVGCLGIWYAVSKGRRASGLTIFLIGAGLSAVDFLVVIPHYSSAAYAPFEARYAAVGGTPTGILRTAVTHPLVVAHEVVTTRKVIYVVLLLLPFAGLWALEPLLFIGAVPDLAVNLLSAKPFSTEIQGYYTAGIVPFLVTAAILGTAKLKRDPARTSFVVLLCVWAIALYSPFFTAAHALKVPFTSSPQVAAKKHALQLIPKDVPVAATNELAGYLSARTSVYIFPYVRNARWLLLDEHDSRTMDRLDVYELRWIRSHPQWKPVYSANGIHVLRLAATASVHGNDDRSAVTSP